MLASILLIVCCLFLPGFTLSLILFPRLTDLNPLERFGVSVGLSFILISITGLLLILFNAYSSFAIYLCIGLEILLFFAISALKYRVLSDFYDYFATREFLKERALLFPAFIIVVVACLSLTYIHKNVSLNTVASFYMAQAKLIAQTGDLSGKLFEWGQYRYEQYDKILFNLSTASIISISNGDYIQIMKVMSFIFLLVSITFAFLFYKQFFNISLAVCGILLTFANVLFARPLIEKFLAFRGESSGWMFLFMFLYCFSMAFFENNKRFFYLSIIVLITLGLWHAVPFVFALIFFVCFYMSRCVVNFRISREEIKSFLLVAVCVPVGISGVLLAGKALYFHKVMKNVMVNESQFELYKGQFDPTWEFQAKLLGRGPRRIKQGSGFYRPAANIYTTVIVKALPVGRKWISRKSFLLEFTAVAAVVLALLLWRIQKKDKILLLTSIGLFIAIVLMGLYFSYKYSTYFPAEHVMRREVNFSSLAGVMLFLMCLKYLKSFVPSKKIIFDVILVLICCVYFLPSTNSFLENYRKMRYVQGDILSDNGLQAFNWLKENTSKDDIVMSNMYTGGSFYLLADRKSITEGRAPYAEKELLTEALTIMEDVQQFFLQPGKDIIKKYNIKYVVFAPAGGLVGRSLVHYRINKKIISNAKFLKKVKSFGTVEIYKAVY